jgi:hypothetical protein
VGAATLLFFGEVFTMGERAGEGSEPRKKPGRPRGSVSLTKEIYDTIVSLSRGGTLPHVAAQAAGISPRTYHDWMARGEDLHPTRTSTPKLVRFARDVRIAQALFRARLEIRIANEDPKYYLRYAARSRPDYEGWTELPQEEEAANSSTFEDVLAALDIHDEAEARAHADSCTDRACIRRNHRGRNR